MKRVVVTGLGAVTPLAVGAHRSWAKLLAGQCGVKSLTERGQQFDHLPSQVAALVPHGSRDDGMWNASDWLAPGDDRRMGLFTQFAIAAASEALHDADWLPINQSDKDRTGVCIGSGMGGFNEMFTASLSYQNDGYRKVSSFFVPRLLINLASGHVTMKFGFRGPNHAVSTACTTGAHSIGDASRFITFGDADVMVAGSSEACIHPLAIAGFARAKSLATAWNHAPRLASRPFDRDRAGFVIGEGAGILVLEELEHAKRRGARIYAELKGYGLSSDAHHITAPPNDGSGAYLAMCRSLECAGHKPKEVGYVNAHATSTPIGDAAENRAIKKLFTESKNPHEINVSSCKGAIGHLLGAAGAVEAIFTVLAVHHNILPPTLNLENPGDPKEDFPFNYVPHKAQETEVKVALSNSFGFGGTNATLCFSKVE